ncbi:MAG: AraC family transcriptional regulator [Cyanobacteria bacterium P01_G01_bin.49]
MTISLTRQEFYELFQEADKEELKLDLSDELDTTWKHDGRIGLGWQRLIQLREGIRLRIDNEKYHDRLLIHTLEYESALHWHFFLSGNLQTTFDSHSSRQTVLSYETGRHIIYGRGLDSQILDDHSDTEPFLEVLLEVQPEVLRSFVSDSSGELPQVFKHLVKSPDRDCYKRVRETPPMVNALLQQIVQCDKQGISKRMILEGITTQIMGLMLEEEAAVQQGEFKKCLLQKDLLDRIYYAKEILLKDLKKSPSLGELAQQAGTCEYNLKRGFKEVFGTTVYGYLRDRRMEKAQQLLLDGQMGVGSIAKAIGYDSHSSFTHAFKQKYGVSPKAYQISMRK